MQHDRLMKGVMGKPSSRKSWEKTGRKVILVGKKQDEKITVPTGCKAKVLVMDDDPFVGSLIRSLLKDSGYEARITKSGIEAIEYFREAEVHGNPFTAVILDLHVHSGMGGDKALEKLRDIDPEVKAILLTADICHPAVTDYKLLGFKSAIIKPFTRNDLQLALDQALGTA